MRPVPSSAVAVAVALAVALLAPALRADDVTTTWTDLGGGLAGSAGTPVLAGSGDPIAGAPVQVTLAGAAPSAPCFVVLGLSESGLPLLGGTLVPFPDAVAGPFATDAAGALAFDVAWGGPPFSGVDLWLQAWVVDAGAPAGAAASNGLVASPSFGPASGTFPDHWIDGTDCASEPPIQVHAYNEDLYVLRQSLCTSFEGPFLFLLLGRERALLVDTGDGDLSLAPTVYQLVQDWTAAQGIVGPYELVVAHTHAHGDHVAGDDQFEGQPDTTVVGLSPTEVQEFFGITSWPDEVVSFDLGRRVVDVVPIPGHEKSSVAFYDRETAILITGDSLYPGRIYVFGATSAGQWPVFQASVQRLVDFVADETVCWVLGTHIEMTKTPGVDYPFGAAAHPDEHVLQLTVEHLHELNDAVQAMGDTPVVEVHDDFLIVPIF